MSVTDPECQQPLHNTESPVIIVPAEQPKESTDDIKQPEVTFQHLDFVPTQLKYAQLDRGNRADPGRNRAVGDDTVGRGDEERSGDSEKLRNTQTGDQTDREDAENPRCLNQIYPQHREILSPERKQASSFRRDPVDKPATPHLERPLCSPIKDAGSPLTGIVS
jgi:hypothetical protein